MSEVSCHVCLCQFDSDCAIMLEGQYVCTDCADTEAQYNTTEENQPGDERKYRHDLVYKK